MEFWLLAESRIFRPQISRITILKWTLPETMKKTACNNVLIFLMTFMIDTIIYWILDKSYAFSRTFVFAWIL